MSIKVRKELLLKEREQKLNPNLKVDRDNQELNKLSLTIKFKRTVMFHRVEVNLATEFFNNQNSHSTAWPQ